MSEPTTGAVAVGSSPGLSNDGSGSGHGAGKLERGSLNARHIIFMVIAAAAPMAVVVAIVPIALAFGNGIGTPGMFLVAAITLAFFSVGYTRATPYIRNAGAFYAYITQGINRALGLVAAYLAVICYTALAAATCGALAFFSADTASRLLGIDLSWVVWAGIWIAVVGLLGYRRITVAARVLGVALLAEVTLLLILDFAILGDNGVGSLSLESFAPGNVFGGVVGVAVIYAFIRPSSSSGHGDLRRGVHDPLLTVPCDSNPSRVILTSPISHMITSGLSRRRLRLSSGDPGSFRFRFLSVSLQLLLLADGDSNAAASSPSTRRLPYFYASPRGFCLPLRTLPLGSPYIAG
jgi:hypothetical protein